MFDSLSNIFSLPTTNKNKYKTQPSLQQCLKTHSNSLRPPPPPDDAVFDSLLQNLQNPVEQWILLQEPYLKSIRVNKTIYQLVIQNCHKSKVNLLGQPNITIHNLFVLMVQYEVMSQFVIGMSMTQLQLLIDGTCGILIRNPEDSMEELTCVLHHILTKCQLYHSNKRQPTPILTRPLNPQNIPHFITIYGQLPQRLQTSFIDVVVRVIPMLAQLFKLVLKTNPRVYKHQILNLIPWCQNIAISLLDIIVKNIDEIVKASTEGECLDQISFEDQPNGQLKKKLILHAIKTFDQAAFVSKKELFTFACRQLYYLQHVFRLCSYMTQLVYDVQDVYPEYQQNTINFLKHYLKTVIDCDFNIPINHHRSISKIIKKLQFQHKKDVIHIATDIDGPLFINSVKVIKDCPLYQWQNRQSSPQTFSRPQFSLEREDCLLIYFLRLIYNLHIQFIQSVNSILHSLPKAFLLHTQLYLIKNGFLHFLIDQQINLQGEDKSSRQLFFQTVSNLVKNNTHAYCVLDQILRMKYEHNNKCQFQDQVRKHFFEAKDFLTATLADTIHINSNYKQSSYFRPFPLQLLLYPDQTRHDIWISYIHDVIVRQQRSQQQKLQKLNRPDPTIQKDINEWISLAIMIQIEYVQQKRGEDLQLGQFTMNYLTNILNQAIKWKYEDQTAVMKRILSNYEQWEIYYTQVILNTENNQDIIQTQLGPTVTFLFLRRWNRKIINSIKIFIQSVLTTVIDPDAPLF